MIGIHGTYYDSQHLLGSGIEIVKKICPDKNGYVSLKAFRKNMVQLFVQKDLPKNLRTSATAFLVRLLPLIIKMLESQDNALKNWRKLKMVSFILQEYKLATLRVKYKPGNIGYFMAKESFENCEKNGCISK